MNNIISLLKALGLSRDNIFIIVCLGIGLFIFYKFIQKDISHIKENQNNHITTKLEELKEGQNKLDTKIDEKFNLIIDHLLNKK